MEYKVVTGRKEYLNEAELELEKEVNRLLAQGWILQGGVSIDSYNVGYGSRYILAQALVRGEDRTVKNNDVRVTLL